MKAVLDTSVLIGEDAPADVEAAISVASITELHFGVLVTDDADERARRADRLAAAEATFDPLPVTLEVARAWGRLAAAVAQRGGKPRRRQIDLARAATDPQRRGLPDHQRPCRGTPPLSVSSSSLHRHLHSRPKRWLIPSQLPAQARALQLPEFRLAASIRIRA